MDEQDKAWMAYIHDEVAAASEATGLGYQLRRRWEVRDHPVAGSTIEDYEWKLVVDGPGRLPDAPPRDFNGTYYVLRFERSRGCFVFQHDTLHVGIKGPSWDVTTCSEVRLDRGTAGREHPRSGWLRAHLVDLVARFGPNHFSVT